MHHAKKNEASGFCYVNDIVLAILELLKVGLGFRVWGLRFRDANPVGPIALGKRLVVSQPRESRAPGGFPPTP